MFWKSFVSSPCYLPHWPNKECHWGWAQPSQCCHPSTRACLKAQHQKRNQSLLAVFDISGTVSEALLARSRAQELLVALLESLEEMAPHVLFGVSQAAAAAGQSLGQLAGQHFVHLPSAKVRRPRPGVAVEHGVVAERLPVIRQRNKRAQSDKPLPQTLGAPWHGLFLEKSHVEWFPVDRHWTPFSWLWIN